MRLSCRLLGVVTLALPNVLVSCGTSDESAGKTTVRLQVCGDGCCDPFAESPPLAPKVSANGSDTVFLSVGTDIAVGERAVPYAVTLVSSAGAFEEAESGAPTKVTLDVGAAPYICTRWRAPSTIGNVSVFATAYGVRTPTQSFSVTGAPIASLVVTPDPLPIADNATSVELSVETSVAPPGHVSQGTRIDADGGASGIIVVNGGVAVDEDGKGTLKLLVPATLSTRGIITVIATPPGGGGSTGTGVATRAVTLVRESELSRDGGTD